MNAAPIPWKHVRNVLVLFAPLWVGAAMVFGLFAAGYSLFSSDVWSARQPLVIRDEATGSVDRLGRFASQTELKAAQETILEMAQNPEVVAGALRQIGPPGGGTDASWPSRKIVDKVAESCVNLVAPQGSEFGNTEVVYLSVKSKEQDRSVEFCRAMFDNLTKQLRKVRRVRADSIIIELTHARDIAQRNLDDSLAEIRKIEVQFGSDLGELRNLNDTIAGEGANRRTLELTATELQTAQLELNQQESFHRALVAGAADPQKLLISGNDLLASQPSLQRLKEGLIDAQLESSRLSGNLTELNPKRRNAIAIEQEIKRRMQQETAAVIRAMEPELKLARDRVSTLQGKAQELENRLDHLAEIRTTYAKLDSRVKSRSEQLAQAESSLSNAVAIRSAALSTNLLAELGPPQVGDSPVGMSGSVMTLGGSMAGLIFGLGVVFLVAPGPTEMGFGRRWSDYLGGRRASDPAPGSTNARSTDNGPTDTERRTVPPMPSSPTTEPATPGHRSIQGAENGLSVPAVAPTSSSAIPPATTVAPLTGMSAPTTGPESNFSDTLETPPTGLPVGLPPIRVPGDNPCSVPPRSNRRSTD
ncbi:MAG: hypothetical protein AAF989_14055 [Planctomycetota bacterium]